MGIAHCYNNLCRTWRLQERLSGSAARLGGATVPLLLSGMGSEICDFRCGGSKKIIRRSNSWKASENDVSTIRYKHKVEEYSVPVEECTYLRTVGTNLVSE